METKFQTSFIPKTTLEPIASGSHKPMSFFSFIATIIFFISVLVGGGAFGWHKYLEAKQVTVKESLERNVKSFEPQTIEEYVRLNNRIDSAKLVLAKHIAVSYVFDYLSEQTIESVKFSDFKYDIGADGSATLSMNGEAKSYNAVAYQSEVFGRERSFKSPLFSNLDLDINGNVIFNFTTKIDPAFIAYARKANTISADDQGDIMTLPETGVQLLNTTNTNASGTTTPLIKNN